MGRLGLGIAGVVLVVAAAIRMAGGQAGLWLHTLFFYGSFALVVPVVALHTIWSRQALRRALAHALRPRPDLGGAAGSIRIWRAAEGLTVVSGLLGALGGFILSLSFLGVGAFGPKFAASLTPLFVGLLMAVVYRILQHRVASLQGLST